MNDPGGAIFPKSCPASAPAGAPPRLSRAHSRVAIRSTHGSGVFGRWVVDAFGLPAYRYTLNELKSPFAKQSELAGRNDAWHQVGNDHVVADAFNHGWTQLWSQDRRYEWANLYQPSSNHFTGGFGYLRVDGRTISTLYDARPPSAVRARRFGVGYYGKHVRTRGLDVHEFVYAPFGDDPLRILRAARFAAKLGFTVADDVRAAMTDQAGRLEIVSVERHRAFVGIEQRIPAEVDGQGDGGEDGPNG